MKATLTFFTLLCIHCFTFGQIVTPQKKPKPVRTRPLRASASDTGRVYIVQHAPQNMRLIQFGLELGTVFIADSAQRYYLPKKQVIHYGLNLRIGDIYKNRVYGILGVELYANKAYKSKPAPVPSANGSTVGINTGYSNKNVLNFMGYMGCQVPFHLSELTSINLSSAAMLGYSATPNVEDQINYFGIRLAASVERRLGNLPVIGVFGVAYDNNFLFRDDRSPATRNPNLLKLYFGIRI